MNPKNHIPAEGENGLFTQSWFPICPSYEVERGKIVGKTFLDGRVIVVRGDSGDVQVMSPYCPHLGTDLSIAEFDGKTFECPFHRWTFNLEGECIKTAIGDPAPKSATLFRFPTVERYGMIWAFNGTEATWPLPELPVPDEELSIRVRYDVPLMPLDPWMVCANTPDWQHIRVVHQFDFDTDDIFKSVEWTDNSMEYDLRGCFDQGPEADLKVGIFGTSMFRLHGMFDGEWRAVITPFGIPSPGNTQNYFITCFRKDAGSEAELEEKHLAMFEFGKLFTADDRPIFHNIRYRPGALTKSDHMLAKYLDIVRNYPRAHPSSEFIK